MMNTSAEAFAPATVANLGVGFDILGLALCEPGDVVRVERLDEPGARVLSITGDGGKLPYAAEKNTACVAANSLLKQLGSDIGVGINIEKHLELSSGLGSSAASAVAGAVAVNALLGEPLDFSGLLPACLDGEAAVSGYHADNVGPCLFGGITLVTGVEAGQIHNLPIPQNLYLTLVTPDVEVPTVMARSVLPEQVSLKAMVAQTAAVARLMHALYTEDLEALAHAMEDDRVVEPARVHLMPMLYEVRAAAKHAGALGMVISGAGPTLCAVCSGSEIAQRVLVAMQTIYEEAGIRSIGQFTPVSRTGARVLNIG